MTRQTIDIADAVIPVPGPVVASLLELLNKLPRGQSNDIATALEAAVREFAANQQGEPEEPQEI